MLRSLPAKQLSLMAGSIASVRSLKKCIRKWAQATHTLERILWRFGAEIQFPTLWEKESNKCLH
jgi:hypothetical protein